MPALLPSARGHAEQDAAKHHLLGHADQQQLGQRQQQDGMQGIDAVQLIHPQHGQHQEGEADQSRAQQQSPPQFTRHARQRQFDGLALLDMAHIKTVSAPHQRRRQQLRPQDAVRLVQQVGSDAHHQRYRGKGEDHA